MTKEALLERKATLQAEIKELQRQQLVAKGEVQRTHDLINANAGAVQDCDFWLAQLELQEPGKLQVVNGAAVEEVKH